MCWNCCMHVLEKCLPRNDIVRELAPYLQHVHRDEAADGGAIDESSQHNHLQIERVNNNTEGEDFGGIETTSDTSPVHSHEFVALDDIEKGQATGASTATSHLFNNNSRQQQQQQQHHQQAHTKKNSNSSNNSIINNSSPEKRKRSGERHKQNSMSTTGASLTSIRKYEEPFYADMDNIQLNRKTSTNNSNSNRPSIHTRQVSEDLRVRNENAAMEAHDLRSYASMGIIGLGSEERTGVAPNDGTPSSSTISGATSSSTLLTPGGSIVEGQLLLGVSTVGGGVGGSALCLQKKQSIPKIKTELGDLLPVRWDKVVIVQVCVENFKDMMSKSSKELMDDAKLLYEHTVLSRLSSEYGGQEILSQPRAGLFVIAFSSEFHAAKWCLSLQLSLVYAAWNDKLVKLIPQMQDVYALPNTCSSSSSASSIRSKKPILLHRGFRVKMVIHAPSSTLPMEQALPRAVKWTKAISQCVHGGQIVLSESVWDRLKEQLVQLGNPVVEDLGAHVPLALIEDLGIEEGEIQLMQLLPRDLELRRFNKLRRTKQTALGMRDAPSATSHVTMVFTFIEGARPLVRCHAEELANRIKQLCMKARKLLRKYNGYECQELQGDFMLAFFNPCDAILWCGEFQLHISQMFDRWHHGPTPTSSSSSSSNSNSNEQTPLMFSMSMGIETGIPASVSPHKTSGRADYFGNIVNQTARIAKAAHGGQILIGGDAWNALMGIPYSMNGCIPSDVLEEVEEKNLFRFKGHGHHSFKGISLPIGLVEAIPLEPQQVASCTGGLFLETPPTTPHPKAKPATESQLRNLKRTTLSNVPPGLWRLQHRDHRTTQSTIRETEIHLGLASLSMEDEIIAVIESGGCEDELEDVDEESEEEEDVRVVERAEDIRVSTEDNTSTRSQQQMWSSIKARKSKSRRRKIVHLQQQVVPPQQQSQSQIQGNLVDQKAGGMNHSGVMNTLANSSFNSSIPSIASSSSPKSTEVTTAVVDEEEKNTCSKVK